MQGPSRVLLISLVAAGIAVPALAQNPSPRDHRLLLLPTAQFGAPLGLSGGLGIFFRTSEDGQLVSGPIVEGSAGQGGVSGGFGYQRFLEYAGLDVRGIVHRTWSSPRGAAADSTYIGGEAGLTIAFVRLSVGVAHRIAGTAGERATIKTWTAGIVVPIWR